MSTDITMIKELKNIKEIKDITKKVTALLGNSAFNESDDLSSIISYHSVCEHIVNEATEGNLMGIIQYTRNISGSIPEDYYLLDGYMNLVPITHDKLNNIIDELMLNF